MENLDESIQKFESELTSLNEKYFKWLIKEKSRTFKDPSFKNYCAYFINYRDQRITLQLDAVDVPEEIQKDCHSIFLKHFPRDLSS